MTPEELVELFRLDVDDTDPDDPLWSTLEVYNYLDEAQKEFARKTDYFSDASTPEIVDIVVNKIDLTADPVVVDATHMFADLDYRITKIRSAKLISSGEKVDPMTYADMELVPAQGIRYTNYIDAKLDWETARGRPRYIVTDIERGKVRIAPMHTSNVPSPLPADLTDIIRLQVYRLPLKDLTEGSSKFEVQESEYQRSLLPYMKYLAYSKNDVDTFEQDLADRSQAQAINVFATIKRDLRRVRYAATTGTVRYGGL